MWTIPLPLKVPVSKKKFFHLNLNPYRNANHFTLDRAKKEFFNLVKGRLRGVPKLDRVALEYVLYPGTAQLCDVNNICTIVDKFFSDTLVTMRVIEDDNYNFIADSRFRFGAIDRVNPRVDVIIRSPDHIPLVPPEVVQESEHMKIVTKTITLVNFTPRDVETAFREYLSRSIENLDPNAELDMTQTEDGCYEISIEQEASLERNPNQEATTPAPSKPAKERRKKADPKEAMELLHQAATEAKQRIADQAPVETEAAEQEDAQAEPGIHEPEPELPVVGEEKGHASSLFSVVAVNPPEPEKKKEETPPPAPTTGVSSLFSTFKRPENTPK